MGCVLLKTLIRTHKDQLRLDRSRFSGDPQKLRRPSELFVKAHSPVNNKQPVNDKNILVGLTINNLLLRQVHGIYERNSGRCLIKIL